ncbi:MAG: lipopolysaccharide kinase InaA family protein [Arhodomonas sp.]|nr:lipopolysaccharide kinase InaA family protein [Arhodomonas sp.]
MPVSEYLEGRPSDGFFRCRDVTVQRKRVVAYRILQAIRHLHANGYVHGDLKGKNILVRDDVPYFIDLDTLRQRWLGANRGRGISKDYARLIQTDPIVTAVRGSRAGPTSASAGYATALRAGRRC